MSAQAQVARMLALVPLIERRGEMSIDEASRTLGVAADQLVADLRVLMYCGWPGLMPGDLIEVDLDALDGDGLIKISNADYLARPLRLSSAEAAAIVVALRTLRESTSGDTLDSLDRALAKLEAVTEDGASVDVHVPEAQRAAANLRQQLASALSDHRQVRLTYYVPARDEQTERVVDPISLDDAQGSAYLQAWCHTAGGRRLFRLDRILDAKVLATEVEEHPELTPLDLSTGLFRPAEEDPLVTLALAPEARWVAEYYPVEAVREDAAGGLEVDLRVADVRWLQRLLLRLTPHVRVVGPPEFTQSFTEAARAVRNLYT